MDIRWTDFDIYREKKGQLTQPEFEAIKTYEPTEQYLEQAGRMASSMLEQMSMRPEGFCGQEVHIISRMLGVMGEKEPLPYKTPGELNDIGLVIEAYLVQGNDPKPFLDAAMRLLFV